VRLCSEFRHSKEFVVHIRLVFLPRSASVVSLVLALIVATVSPSFAQPLDESLVAGGATQPDVALQLVDAPDPTGAGKLLTYRISIENRGSATASNVTLSTSIPAGTVFKEFRSPRDWQVTTPAPGATGSVTAFFASLPTGPRFNFELTVGVSEDAVDGSTIENSATVSLSETDADPANNTQSTSTRVLNRPPSNANLRLIFEAGPSPAAANGQIVYTMVVANIGPETATDVVTLFVTPQGTTFSQVFASYGRCEFPEPGTMGEVRCTVEAITERRPLIITIVVNVTASAGSTIQSRALVGTTSNDPDLGNNVSTMNTMVIAAGPNADLSVAISGAPDPVISGQIVAYEVTVRNDGPMPSRDTTAFFRIPDGGRFRGASTDMGLTQTPPIGATGPIAWRPGFLASGAVATLHVAVLAFENAGTPFNAGAMVIGGAADPNFDNNVAQSMARVRSAGTALVQWDPPDSDGSDDRPAPRNLLVLPTNVAMSGKSAAAGKTLDANSEVLTYNIYVASTPNVEATDENFYTSVSGNETTTTAPTAPGGSFFTVTATYTDGDSDSADAAGTGDDAGATITKVKLKNGKLTLKGSGFTDEVEVLLDGIPYSDAATVKKQNTKAIQGGMLVTGQSSEEYVATGTSFVIIVRNSDGGVTLVEYEP
jgi:uncharacterized repeat protein (TIGR01451 family)